MDQKEKDKLREAAGIELLAEQDAKALAKSLSRSLKGLADITVGITLFKQPKLAAVKNVLDTVEEGLKTATKDVKKLRKILSKVK